MAVEKFRSVADMNAAPVRASQEEGIDRFFRHCARYRAIALPRYPRGVFRFRSLQEAQHARTASHDNPPHA